MTDLTLMNGPFQFMPDMIGLRVCLLGGLAAHKLVWEVLKRREGQTQAIAKTPTTTAVRVVKALKVAILLGLVAQTVMPVVLPMANAPAWLPAAGLAIYLLGLAVAIAARLQLGKNWSDIEVGAVKRDHAVVSNGIYGYIRHPIYVGDLTLLVGLELALQSWLVVPVIVLVPLVLRKAVGEERKLVASLPGYEAYCRRTNRFVPFPKFRIINRSQA